MAWARTATAAAVAGLAAFAAWSAIPGPEGAGHRCCERYGAGRRLDERARLAVRGDRRRPGPGAVLGALRRSQSPSSTPEPTSRRRTSRRSTRDARHAQRKRVRGHQRSRDVRRVARGRRRRRWRRDLRLRRRRQAADREGRRLERVVQHGRRGEGDPLRRRPGRPDHQPQPLGNDDLAGRAEGDSLCDRPRSARRRRRGQRVRNREPCRVPGRAPAARGIERPGRRRPLGRGIDARAAHAPRSPTPGRGSRSQHRARMCSEPFPRSRRRPRIPGSPCPVPEGCTAMRAARPLPHRRSRAQRRSCGASTRC